MCRLESPPVSTPHTICVCALQVAKTEMDSEGFATHFAYSPPQDSPLAPTDGYAGEQPQGKVRPRTFVDSIKMPVGAARRVFLPEGGELYMYGYIVPLASNKTRHFINFSSVSDQVGLAFATTGALPAG